MKQPSAVWRLSAPGRLYKEKLLKFIFIEYCINEAFFWLYSLSYNP